MTQTNPMRVLEAGEVFVEESRVETFYVCASATFEKSGDITAADQMSLMETSGSLSFWEDPKEDLYDDTDGEPV